MEQFDQHTVEYARNWRHITSEMRQKCPVAHTDAHGGYYVLTRYNDIKAALQDPTTFVNGRVVHGQEIGGVTIPRNAQGMGMFEMDAPEATPHRRMIVPWFSPKAVANYRPRMHELVDWCLDRIIEKGEFDVVDDIANPLPALVITDMMGIPLEKAEKYGRTLHHAVYLEKGSGREVAWMMNDLAEFVHAKRLAAPEPTNVVNAIVMFEVNGELISEEFAAEQIFMLLNGGMDTSTSLIAQIFLYLDEHWDKRRQLIDNPELIPAAVDELARWAAPATGAARTVSKPATLHGVELTPGDRVFVSLASANNDESVFPDPDEVDFERADKGSLTFGYGVHRCPGSFLAPAEIAILLEHTLTRIPDYRIDRDRVQAYPTVPLVNGFVQMPATSTPGPKVGKFDSTRLPVA